MNQIHTMTPAAVDAALSVLAEADDSILDEAIISAANEVNVHAQAYQTTHAVLKRLHELKKGRMFKTKPVEEVAPEAPAVEG